MYFDNQDDCFFRTVITQTFSYIFFHFNGGLLRNNLVCSSKEMQPITGSEETNAIGTVDRKEGQRDVPNVIPAITW